MKLTLNICTRMTQVYISILWEIFCEDTKRNILTDNQQQNLINENITIRKL